MPPVAAIGAGIGALGSVAGGIIQGNAAKSAAETQAAAAQQAMGLQKQVYDQTRSDNQPYMQAGTQALSQMQDPYFQHSFGASDFQQDPGYQFRLDQGQKALERSAAARGGLQSGGTLKALTDYGQGMASQEYQNAYNRFTNDQSNRFGRLSNIAGMGQNAVGVNAGAGSNYATQATDALTGSANAQGAASMASGNMWGHTLSGLGSGVGKTMMDMQAAGKMQDWMNQGNPGVAGPSLGVNTSLGSMPNFNF